MQVDPAETGTRNAQRQCGRASLLPVPCALLEVAGLETMRSRAEADRRAPDAAFVVMLFGVEYGLAVNVQPTEAHLEKLDLEGAPGRNLERAVEQDRKSFANPADFVGEEGGRALGVGRAVREAVEPVERRFSRVVVDAIVDIECRRSRIVGDQVEIAKRHRAMVALDHQRGGGDLVIADRAAGRPADFQVLVDGYAVDFHGQEPGVPALIAGGVEPGRLERNAKILPEPRRLAGVDPRRRAFELGAVLAPPLVDAAAVGEFGPRCAPTVQQLHLVATLQIDAGVRSPGHHELEFEIGVTVFEPAQQIVPGCGGRTVDEYPFALDGFQAVLFLGVSPYGAGGRPVGPGGLKCRQVGKVVRFSGLCNCALDRQQQCREGAQYSPIGEQAFILR